MPPQVVSYARISQDRGASGKGSGEGIGVRRQLDDCREFAAKQGLDLIGEYADNDTSAYLRSRPRPRWEEVVDLVRAGSIDGIVAWHVDRLYRHPKDLEEIIELVGDRPEGMRFYIVMSGELDLNTSSGRQVARLLGSIARGEVEKNSERIARAHLDIAQAGGWKGGRRALGYESDGLTINPREAAALRAGAEVILGGGTLNAASKTVGGLLERRIAPTTLRGVLTSYRIAGLRQHWPAPSRREYARKRERNEVSGLPEYIPNVKAAWDGILTKEEWGNLRDILLDPARRTHRARPRKSLLAGLLKCGLCDNEGRTSFLGYSAKNYSCPGETSGGCGGRVAVSTTRVEEFVLRQVNEVLEHAPDTLDTLPIVSSEDSLSREADEAALTQCTVRKQEALDLWVNGDIDRDALVYVRRKMDDELKQISERIRIRQMADDRNQFQSKIAEHWSEATILERAAVIRVLIDHVLVAPAIRTGRGFDESRLTIAWNRDGS